ncbi:MAG: DJ-1/PfpI family protein [Candidatus Cloacimonetes bacterium]|nr:DJ-1/PfpI family protein [Candidatus Cloacimonadota bacterium]
MKKLMLYFIILVSVTSLSAENVKALMILPDNYGANFYCYLELCRNLGWDITTASVNQVVTPCPSYAAPLGCGNITVDSLICEISDVTIYDCIMIHSSTSFSGNPYYEFLNDVDTMLLLGLADAADIVIWTSCAGVRLLGVAGIAQGVSMQCPAGYQNELTAAGANIVGEKIPPVIDGNIITTMRGQFYTQQNVYAILTALKNLQEVEE